MTQIIVALTSDYVLLASDRKLTNCGPDGKPTGVPNKANECKLVHVSNLFGVGYTGHAELEGMPTHEWIAVRLGGAQVL